MKESASRSKVSPKLQVFLGLAALLVAFGVVLAPFGSSERAHAQALVEQGQHALATGDTSGGVLAIERARWIAPRAGFVRNAVDAARIDDPEPIYLRVTQLIAPREWACAATAFGWMAGITIAACIVLKKKSWFLRTVAVGGVAGLFASMAATAASTHAVVAVVTASDVRALVSPYAESDVAGQLPPGTVVLPGETHGGFVRVRTKSGVEGWTLAGSLEPVARVSS